MFLSELKNNNECSFTMLEKGTAFIAILLLGCFALDAIMFASTMVTASHQVSYLADKLMAQGGFIGVSTDTKHWSNEEIYNYLLGGFEKNGVDGKSLNWGLDYKDNVNSSGWSSVINTANGSIYSKTWTSRNNAGSFSAVNSYGKTSEIRLWYEFKFRFAGTVFKINTKKINLTADFRNEFINNSY